MNFTQVVLIVLDGWGYREETRHNAIWFAKTPFFDSLWSKYPHSLLEASGLGVGLPRDEIGSSEVGHMAMGAGKVLDTDVIRISKFIKERGLESNSVFQKLFSHVKKHGSTLHILGLVSPGGVHSHQEHLFGVLKAAEKTGVNKIAIHVFTDGRDTPPKSAAKYVEDLEKMLKKLKVGEIVSVCGRYYSMDRDNNWDRLEKFSEILFDGIGEIKTGQASELIKKKYEFGETDEHIRPFRISNTKLSAQIKPNDGVMFFNFRADRARMLSEKIFQRVETLNLEFVTMTKHEDGLGATSAFEPIELETTLGQEISRAGLTQVRIGETEKFAHVTYFFNGGRREPYSNEKQILIESRKDVSTHDLAPKMRAPEITQATIQEIEKGANFIVVNFANADMVGHTANQAAVVEAVEELDRDLSLIIPQVLKRGGVAIITADHGNAEMTIDEKSGDKHTAHTTSKVPLIITKQGLQLKNGKLANIAPTVLQLLGLSKPTSMTEESLIKE